METKDKSLNGDYESEQKLMTMVIEILEKNKTLVSIWGPQFEYDLLLIVL